MSLLRIRGSISLLLRLKMNSSQEEPPLAALQKRKRGWHAKATSTPPCVGKGSATVSPIRAQKDITRIKDALSKNPRDLSLFVTGIHVGLRGSDLLNLKWATLIDEEGEIRHRITVSEKKTGNARHIALQEKVRQTLDLWKLAVGEAALPGAYVWPGRGNKPLTIQRLHQLVNAWCKSAGVRGHFGTHSLRKTYGFHLRRLGYDIELLMKIFGHSSASITLRYIGVEQDEIDEANLKLVL